MLVMFTWQIKQSIPIDVEMGLSNSGSRDEFIVDSNFWYNFLGLGGAGSFAANLL